MDVENKIIDMGKEMSKSGNAEGMFFSFIKQAKPTLVILLQAWPNSFERFALR